MLHYHWKWYCLVFYTIVKYIQGLKQLNIYLEKEQFRNGLSEFGVLEHQNWLTGNSSSCARLCTRHPDCVAFFENSFSQECRLLSVYSDLNDLYHQESFKYFASPNCSTDNGYIYDIGSRSCFKLYTTLMTMDNARLQCLADGGRLIQIQTEEQQIAVSRYLDQLGADCAPTVDGHRVDNSSTYRFHDGTNIRHLFWSPSYFTANNKGRHCLKLQNSYSNRKWKPAYCSRESEFICETLERY